MVILEFAHFTKMVDSRGRLYIGHVKGSRDN